MRNCLQILYRLHLLLDVPAPLLVCVPVASTSLMRCGFEVATSQMASNWCMIVTAACWPTWLDEGCRQMLSCMLCCAAAGMGGTETAHDRQHAMSLDVTGGSKVL